MASQFSLKSSLAGRTPQVQAAVLQVVSENGLSDPQVSSVDSKGRTTVTASRPGKFLGVWPVNYNEKIVFNSEGQVESQKTSILAAIFIR